jgi:hypothetical protein
MPPEDMPAFSGTLLDGISLAPPLRESSIKLALMRAFFPPMR